MIELVVGDTDTARWADGLNELESGRLALVVPPGIGTMAGLAAAVLGALGKPAELNPRWRPVPEASELILAWLAAHRIDRLILIHADWLPLRVFAALVGLLAVREVVLVALVDPGGEDRLAGWAGATRSAASLVEAEVRDEPRRAALAADPARHQRDPIGALGVPAGHHRVGSGELTGAALAAYLDLAGRLRRDGRMEGAVARSTVLVLRQFTRGPQRDEALGGVAAALGRAGWSAWTDLSTDGFTGASAGATWAELRIHPYPDGPAVVGLLAAGLWPPEIAELRVRDVEPDGGAAYVGEVGHLVPLGARAYVVAQRHLRAIDGPDALLVTARRGRPQTAASIATEAAAVLASVGITISGRALLGTRTPSARWLAAQGLVLRPAPVSDEPIRMAPRCQHGLPGELMVEGVVLSHSQSLCRALGPADRIPSLVRRAENGFAVRDIERSRLGVRHGVTCDGRPAGELVGLATPDGTVWLQTGVGRAPALEAIAAAVAADYPAAIGVAAAAPGEARSTPFDCARDLGSPGSLPRPAKEVPPRSCQPT